MHCTRNLLLDGSMDLKTQNMAFPMKAFDVHIFRDIVKVRDISDFYKFHRYAQYVYRIHVLYNVVFFVVYTTY